ncbi:DNA-binding GntR family transcriptional regulator [Geodermatophilus tzadiensis]|uniref:DNA-binding GntR family transcriptional regulator n=1 Tax=Geodermatophilus tzadiensis TaxID=1137988 RepID=A0A2T0TQD1_9ACTN|nr:GntR family transcriptional regulator [Geodermatophilus tzadiensis]PRY47867.1 DNA-binding GntR family transcriptional regulator [Geodermatophilus tzadiensis]
MTAAEEGAATKSQRTHARVREMVLSGELAPGSVINQAVLARELGVSTTPLREALRLLKQEGLVELDAHRDARVTPLDAAEARDLLELRQSLDPLAAGLAAQRRTAEDLARMRAALGSLTSLHAGASPAQLDGHRAFHAAVYRASHNALLVEALDGLWDKTDRYRRHALAAGRSEEEVEQRAAEHRALLDAVSDRDAEAAAALMRTHVETSLGARSADRLAAEQHGRAVHGGGRR